MKAISLLSAATLAFAGLALAPEADAQVIKIDGSSTVFPITEAVAEEFQIQKRGKVRVTVGISGTGGGFKKFCRGETDIQDASRPILAAEMEACRAAGIKYYELPIAYDALTVVVNPQNNWITQLTIPELKKIWEPASQGKVTRWNQINPKWPNETLALFGPGSDSGTFDYFTEAVVGKAKSSRGDYTGSEDDNVLVQGVASNKNALGYFGYAYYQPNASKLKAVPIVGKSGKAVGPSLDNVVNGSYEPLSRPIFIYVAEKSAQRPEVKEFVEYYLAKSVPLIEEVKYVPLPRQGLRPGGKALPRRQARHRLRRRARSRPQGRGAAGSRSQALSRLPSMGHRTSLCQHEEECGGGIVRSRSRATRAGIERGRALQEAMTEQTAVISTGTPAGLRFRKARDRVVEAFLLLAALVAVFTTIAIVIVLVVGVAAILQGRAAQGLPDRHDVDSALRRAAVRRPAARRGNAGDDAGRARCRDPGGNDHRDLPERVRAVSPPRDDQAGARAARRRADRRLRLLRADDRDAAPAEAHSRAARDSTCCRPAS